VYLLGGNDCCGNLDIVLFGWLVDYLLPYVGTGGRPNLLFVITLRKVLN